MNTAAKIVQSVEQDELGKLWTKLEEYAAQSRVRAALPINWRIQLGEALIKDGREREARLVESYKERSQ